VAAQSKGYQAVGIDPSLGAVMAARRVARQLGLPNRYLVGDARYLPFRPQTFDNVFSYSVIQHLSRTDAARAVSELGRVVRPGGTVKVQMPNRFGIRCLYHQAHRWFREAAGFEVRYWTLPKLRRLFTAKVGRTRFEADGFFGIGLQSSDTSLMPITLKVVLRVSESLKAASRRLPALVWLADSVFVESAKAGR
jgi:SAM-dependent methyltransferase